MNGVASSEDKAKDESTTQVDGNGTLKPQEPPAEVPSEEGSDEELEVSGSEVEEEEDDEDEEEPVFKYDIFGQSVADVLQKDAASAIAVANNLIVLGTHNGVVHVFILHSDGSCTLTKSTKPHSASITDISLDVTGEFIGTASMDGRVVIHASALSPTNSNANEAYAFDLKRPMRSVSLDPLFPTHTSRAVVCGGMDGRLVLYQKGWLPTGHNDTVLHSGEGPVWNVRWQGNLIAWANDKGVKIYDTLSNARITYIDRSPDAPRADMYKPTLHWQDDLTLLIAWADSIKVAGVRTRTPSQAHLPPLRVEITAVFQVDCMISGILPHSAPDSASAHNPTSSDFLILAFTPPPHPSPVNGDAESYKRVPSLPPELKLISQFGEELSSDVLGLNGHASWGCNDYALALCPHSSSHSASDTAAIILFPKGLIHVRRRSPHDRIDWLVERARFGEALDVVEALEGHGNVPERTKESEVKRVGMLYLSHLYTIGDFEAAARLAPKVLGVPSSKENKKSWEDTIFTFAERGEMKTIIPYIPLSPPLSNLVYEMILAYFLAHDRQTLLDTIKTWPRDIYDPHVVIVAVKASLDAATATATTSTSTSTDSNPEITLLTDCLAHLYISNRQPSLALPHLLRLRRPEVFGLIKEYNLFNTIQDQAYLLVKFDMERGDGESGKGEAVRLLVDHTHSIPVGRVVQQLSREPRYLFLYLDKLLDKDPTMASEFANQQVQLYAKFAPEKLINFLRVSSYYSYEKAYEVCKERDLVPEMVYLLAQMGNYKQALSVIIERMGDVNRAIDFVTERKDPELWEDLLAYSESKPSFIRGLLLHSGGTDVDPSKLIRRIRNGLEIEGLQAALIKILTDFNVAASLIKGCGRILESDCAEASQKLIRGRSGGFYSSLNATCDMCGLPLYDSSQSTTVMFLCRHVVHLRCVNINVDADELPSRPDQLLSSVDPSGRGASEDSYIGAKIAFASTVKGKMDGGCPVHRKQSEGDRT